MVEHQMKVLPADLYLPSDSEAGIGTHLVKNCRIIHTA
jgi:hypothetical protein